MGDIAYSLGDALYLNITNRCPNNCCFCVRNGTEGLGGYGLWLEKEPSAREVIEAIGDPREYEEVVFCGFGEPLMRLDVVKEVAAAVKEYGVPVRINTNGLGNLVHGRNILPELEGLIDRISISLNAEDAKKYQKICRSEYGEQAYDAIIEFIKEAKVYIPDVTVSVLTLKTVDIEKCRKIAKELGVKFRIRTYND